jgi:hypothetical protein
MPLAVDTSTPARVSLTGGPGTGNTVTTATYDPPGSSVLVATAQINVNVAGGGVTGAVTNNGTALTWTTVAERSKSDSGGLSGYAGIFVAALAGARTGMTVTFTGLAVTGGATNVGSPSMKVYVVTGGDIGTPVGGSAEGSSTTNNLTTTGLTTVRDSSLGFVAGSEWNVLGTPTSADTTFDGFTAPTWISGGSGYKALSTAGSSATFNLDAGGTAAAAWDWVSAEIKAGAPSVPPPRPRPILQAVQRSTNW